MLEEAQVTFHFSLFFDSPSAVFILFSLSLSQMGHAFSKVARKLKELYIKSVRSKRNVSCYRGDEHLIYFKFMIINGI